MIVDINLTTEKVTVIEPMTKGDEDMADYILAELYRLYEKEAQRKQPPGGVTDGRYCRPAADQAGHAQ